MISKSPDLSAPLVSVMCDREDVSYTDRSSVMLYEATGSNQLRARHYPAPVSAQ